MAEDRLRALRQTRAELAALAAGRPDDAPIATDARTMRLIAALLGQAEAEIAACGGEFCMGRAVDGVKLWVTRERFDAVQSWAVRLTAVLERIARGECDGADQLIALGAWAQFADRLRALAADALDQPIVANRPAG